MKNSPKIKFVICPGYRQSASDDQWHYINARKLISLYGVNPAECIIFKQEGLEGIKLDGCIWLYPRYNGDYKEHLAALLKDKKK